MLGQLLDLISLAKINLFEPRFESYDPYDMANYTYSGTWTHTWEPGPK